MKNKLLISAILLFFSIFAQAQERGFTANFQAFFDLGTLNNVKGVYPLGIRLNPGYSFNQQLTLSGECTADLALLDDNKYTSGVALGIAGEYAFLIREKRALSIVFSGGHSIYADQWRYYYLDGGLKFRLGGTRYAPVIGVGVRWYGSSTEYFTSPCSCYLSVGFRIN